MSKMLSVELTVDQSRKPADESHARQPLPPSSETPQAVLPVALLEQIQARLTSLGASLEQVQAALAQRHEEPAAVPSSAAPTGTRGSRIVRALLWALTWAAAGAAYAEWRAFETRSQLESAIVAALPAAPPSAAAPRVLVPLDAPIAPAAPGLAAVKARGAFSIDLE